MVAYLLTAHIIIGHMSNSVVSKFVLWRISSQICLSGALDHMHANFMHNEIIIQYTFPTLHAGCVCRPDELIVPKEDPLVQEISDVLREWSVVWKRLYAVSSMSVLYKLRCSDVHKYMHVMSPEKPL